MALIMNKEAKAANPQSEQEQSKQDKKPRHRSPNYPTVGLREAVDKVRQLYEMDGKAGAPAKVAATHIGFKTPHGQAMSVLAALKKFGLVQENDSGKITPTQRAIEILKLPEQDPRRVRALRDAATCPEIYAGLIEEYRYSGLPANDTLESELVTYKSFNPKSVGAFVRDFKDSLEFAGISEFSALDLSGEENSDMQDAIDNSTVERKTPQRTTFEMSSKPILPPPASASKTVSFAVPVDFSATDQKVVTAHIAFDAPLKKEYLARLRTLLQAMEDGLD